MKLVDILEMRAEEQATERVYTFLKDGECETESLTYSELHRSGRALGAFLQHADLTNQRALLLYPPGLDFITAFLGCLYGGTAAVPVYPPGKSRHFSRLAAIAVDSQPRAILTDSRQLPRLASWVEQEPYLRGIKVFATDSPALGSEQGLCASSTDPSDLAFIQYTSGSTSTPKGVRVSHENLASNEEAIRRAFRLSKESVVVSWLPFYHDMGLIGGLLQPLWVGASCILLSPMSFLQRPLRWLAAISRYGGTVSGGPSFAYELCAQQISERDRDSLDLSRWSVAFNGAEPVRASTLERFCCAFGACSFRREAFYPCYGLAEATLLVSGAKADEMPTVAEVSEAALQQGRVEDALAEEGAREIVGCGLPAAGHQVLIVDPETQRPCLPGRVGEIWVAGPSVAWGYWERPEETVRNFEARLANAPQEGPYLRTGDLGFLRNGELFVAGRLKDLIILRGRNYYPQDIERAAESAHPALRSGGGAAFVVETDGEECLVVVHEAGRLVESELPEVLEAVRRAVSEALDLAVHEVVLLRAGGLLRTSSGKVQRHACRAAYLAGELPEIGRSETVPEAGMDAEGEPFVTRAGLISLPSDARDVIFEQLLVRMLARAARRPAGPLAPDLPLTSLGLDSLAIIEVQQELASRLDLPVSFTDLLQADSVRSLAAGLLRELAVEAERRILPRSADEEHGDYPLSQGQRALWFLQRMAPGSAAYNVVAAGRVAGGLDPVALRRAALELARRHPQLRAVFPAEVGEPLQRVQAAEAMEKCVEFLMEDARSWSEAALRERLETEVARPFDLAAGPLFRLAFFARADEAVLLLSVHHIVADFASLAILAYEMGVLLDAERSGLAAELAPLPWRYTDFVRWQSEHLASAGDRLWEHWREALAGACLQLDLPTDRSRLPVPSGRGRSTVVRLGPGLSRDLAALASARRVTLYAVLLATWQILLHRWTERTDFLVGSPLTVRGAPELTGLVGYLINPLPLRARTAGDPPFSGYLNRTWSTVLDAFAHQDLPFPWIVERLQPERDPGRSPVFQTLFVLQGSPRAGEEGLSAFALRLPGGRLALGGGTLESLELRETPAAFDLALSIGWIGGELTAVLQLDADLYDEMTGRRLLASLTRLLAGATSAPQRPLSTLPLLDEAERTQLLVEWSGAPASPFPRVCLHTLVERQAERTPMAVAVVDGEFHLTYGELLERSREQARRLGALGVGPETLVGIFAERSGDLICGLLGVLQAGGAYVPLDPSYPQERVMFMLKDSGVSLVLAQRRTVGRLPQDSGLRVLLLDGEQGGAEESEPRSAEPGNLAYVIYTSGSTGRPKAVAIEHRSAAALVEWAAAAFDVAELHGTLAATSICFDLSIFEIFVPLSRGGKVILAENALALPELPAAGDVTLVNTVPSILRELLQRGPLPRGVRTVNLAGEPLPGDLVRRLYAQPSVQRILNLYGPTEDTTYSTGTVVPRYVTGEPTIGRPLAKTCAYLLDRRLEPVPTGAPAELFLGGRGIARGYLGRPELTAEHFLPDPFSGEEGARLYRTGDVVRHRAGGEIEILGRIDQQVKLRGFRVELGEIEAELRSLPGVRDAAVAVRAGTSGESRLVAYVVPVDGAAPTPEQMRTALRETLPAHMVPAAFVLLSALPLTPSGKVDRQALPSPPAIEGAGGTALRSPVEEMLAGMWSDLLGADSIAPEDSFFDLGGHSLSASRLTARISQTFKVNFSVRGVFEHPTLTALARHVESVRCGAAAPPPISPAPEVRPAPLAPAQQRLWLLDRMAPGNIAFNVPVALKLSGPLEWPALLYAFERILERHEVLRTTFTLFADEPVQVVAPRLAFPFSRIDLTSLREQEIDSEALRCAVEVAQLPFDLEIGPLLRGLLLRCAAEEHTLVVVMHHITFDAWSLGVLIRELEALYGAACERREASLPDLPIQYADYAVWQRQWLEEDSAALQLAYWKRQLAGIPPVLELPANRPHPDVQTWRGWTREIAVPDDLRQALVRTSRREGVTPFMVLLAAFNILLRHLVGRDDIVVGTDVANRNQVEVEPLIGFFVNQLTLRTDLSGNPTFAELLARVREVALGAYANQDLPFERLFEVLRLERTLKHPPVFQVKLILSNLPSGPGGLELSGLRCTPLFLETGTSKLDLVIEIAESRDALSLRFNYNRDVFDPPSLVQMMDGFLVVLRYGLEQAHATLREIDEVLWQLRGRRSVMELSRKPRAASFDKLKTLKARTVGLAEQKLVETGLLRPGQALPLVFTPSEDLEVDLPEWATDHRAEIDARLLEHGAILFRGFRVSSPEVFERFARVVCSELFHENSEHPRETVTGSVYTPVFYPPDQKLLWHNENSFNLQWPMKILFCCMRPADLGGETPLVDSRRVFERLRPEVRERFLRDGVAYIRNYGDGLGLSWQTVFRTQNRAEAEEICRRSEIQLEWKDGDRACTRALRPAAIRHPRTGEMSWFNQAQHFHLACLPRETLESLRALYAEDDMPRHCYGGDGSPIEDEVMAEILSIYQELEIVFPWQAGDILLVDNVLVAHARNPFEGERKLLVSLGDMNSYRDVETR